MCQLAQLRDHSAAVHCLNPSKYEQARDLLYPQSMNALIVRGRQRILLLSSAFLLTLGVACGSGVATGPQGDGGGSTSGSCSQGGACFPGETCSDNSCCPCSYKCVGGKWEMSECAGCAATGCSATVPQDGASCDLCATPPSCTYDDCSQGGHVEANCKDGVWEVSATACEAAQACGDTASARACADSEVCVSVTNTTGPSSTTTYSCETNPCAPSATRCDCAKSLCAATNAPLCVNADARRVQCDDGRQ